jgi:L-amino acid N-acyltransferase YncA
MPEATKRENLERIPFVEIRTADPLDVPEITSIYNEAIAERSATFETVPRSVEERMRWLTHRSGRHPVMVAIGEGKVVAWAAISVYRERTCYDGIGEFSIYVSSAHRGKGIGRTLLSALVDEARKLGYWKLVARIFVTNETSRRLCKNCGFREVGIYEKHGRLDERWVDTVIVERLISENIV